MKGKELKENKYVSDAQENRNVRLLETTKAI